MILKSKTEISNMIGLGIQATETLLKDARIEPIEVGKRVYYDYSSLVEKIQNERKKPDLMDKNLTNTLKEKNTIDSNTLKTREIIKLKNEIIKKKDKYLAKLNTIENELKHIELSEEKYINPRLEKIKCLYDEIIKQKNISQIACLTFAKNVLNINLVEVLKNQFEDYIEDGDYEKEVYVDYGTINKKVVIVVRDGVLMSVKKPNIKNFKK